MVVDQMIVAGIGFRKGASGAEILAAVDATLAAHGIDRLHVGRLATSQAKGSEAGIVEAGQLLGLAVVGIEDARLKAETTITRSIRSQDATGVPSLSEAAALAAAGDGARLLGPRVALGTVTCALAEIAP